MIKKILFGSKDKMKSAYLWNTCAAMLNAFQTVFILMLISRIDPVIDAGVFTIAFAIGNLMMAIGKYGIRQFQVSDVEEKYSFKEYTVARIITSIIMIAASFVYVGVNLASGLYNSSKSIVIILICLAKVIDAVEDVIHGMFQQYLRLDVAGKILSIRMCTYIFVYLVCYYFSKNLILTSAVALLVSFIQFVILNYTAIRGFEIKKKTFEIKNVKNIFVECFPLFIASYLVIYIGNAPKYAIDKVMSSEAQACFTYIFMPVFVISLLSQFVYQPVISKMALLWYEKKISQFNKLILRQIALILLLSVAAIIGGYLLGIPVLSLIYGVDLTDYKKSLVILLIGGGALAIVNFLQMIITVTRKQKLLNIGYLLAFLLFVFGGKTITEKHGMIGISVFYTAVVMILGAVFIVLTIGIIKEYANSDGKTVAEKKQ